MKLNQIVAMVGLGSTLLLGSSTALAQFGAGGNIDPAFAPGGNMYAAQIQKFMLNGYREQLEVKDDAEWKLIEERVQKVMDARREVGFAGAGMMGRMLRRPAGNPGGDGAQPANRRAFSALAGAQGPEEEALQKAIDAKAGNAELKAALAKFVEARKQKQAKLEAAQAELRKVLSLRQEAIASMAGLL